MPIAQGVSLLEELDARRDELLGELDRLNSRIEAVIAQTLAWRNQLEQPASESPPAIPVKPRLAA